MRMKMMQKKKKIAEEQKENSPQKPLSSSPQPQSTIPGNNDPPAQNDQVQHNPEPAK